MDVEGSACFDSEESAKLLAKLVNTAPTTMRHLDILDQTGNRKVRVKLEGGQIVVKDQATDKVICSQDTTKTELMSIEQNWQY